MDSNRIEIYPSDNHEYSFDIFGHINIAVDVIDTGNYKKNFFDIPKRGYSISLLGENKQVIRTFKDILDFNHKLVTAFPYIPIPLLSNIEVLEKIQNVIKKETEEYYSTRLYLITFFFNYIANNDEIRQSELYRVFYDNNEFERRFSGIKASFYELQESKKFSSAGNEVVGFFKKLTNSNVQYDEIKEKTHEVGEAEKNLYKRFKNFRDAHATLQTIHKAVKVHLETLDQSFSNFYSYGESLANHTTFSESKREFFGVEKTQSDLAQNIGLINKKKLGEGGQLLKQIDQLIHLYNGVEASFEQYKSFLTLVDQVLKAKLDIRINKSRYNESNLEGEHVRTFEKKDELETQIDRNLDKIEDKFRNALSTCINGFFGLVTSKNLSENDLIKDALGFKK